MVEARLSCVVLWLRKGGTVFCCGIGKVELVCVVAENRLRAI
jgi:hypothetical protein